jgi:hypothetical protein
MPGDFSPRLGVDCWSSFPQEEDQQKTSTKDQQAYVVAFYGVLRIENPHCWSAGL